MQSQFVAWPTQGRKPFVPQSQVRGLLNYHHHAPTTRILTEERSCHHPLCNVTVAPFGTLRRHDDLRRPVPTVGSTPGLQGAAPYRGAHRRG